MLHFADFVNQSVLDEQNVVGSLRQPVVVRNHHEGDAAAWKMNEIVLRFSFR